MITYCDGAWMRAGQAQTDHLRNFTWADGVWVEYLPDGRTPVTGFPC